MKKIGFLLIAVLLGAIISMAQPGGQRNRNPEEMAKRQTERLKELLGLNKAQEKKVYDLSLENGKKRAEMFQEMRDSGNGFEEMREKMQELRNDENKKMKAILTDEQWTKYEKYLEERRSRRGQGRPGGR